MGRGTTSLWWVAAGLFTLIPARAAWSQGDQAPVIRQIIDGARRNTDGLRSARATVATHVTMTQAAGKLYQPDQDKVITWVFSGPKHRYERSTSGAAVEKIPAYKQEVYAFDGREAKYFVPLAKEGAIRKADDLADTYSDPRQLGFYYSRSVTLPAAMEKASREQRLKLLRTEAHPQGPTYVLQVDVDPDQYERLYVDASMGYLMRSREALSTRNRDQLFSREEILEARQYAPGLWFPTHWRSQGFTAEGDVWLQSDAVVRDLRPNVPVSDDLFRIEFPVGTRVSDYPSNTVYLASTPWLTFRRTLITLAIILLILGFRWWRRRATLSQGAAA